MLLLIVGLSNNSVNAFGWDVKGYEQMYKVIFGSVATLGVAGTYLTGSAIHGGFKSDFGGGVAVKITFGVLSLAAALGLLKIALPGNVFNP